MAPNDLAQDQAPVPPKRRARARTNDLSLLHDERAHQGPRAPARTARLVATQTAQSYLQALRRGRRELVAASSVVVWRNEDSGRGALGPFFICYDPRRALP